MLINIENFEYMTDDGREYPSLKEDTPLMRQMRLDLRVLLSQVGDDVPSDTWAIADELAFILVRNLRTSGYLKET